MSNATPDLTELPRYIVEVRFADGQIIQPEANLMCRDSMLEIVRGLDDDQALVTLWELTPSTGRFDDIRGDVISEIMNASYATDDWDFLPAFIRTHFNNIDPREPSASEMGMSQADYVGSPAQL